MLAFCISRIIILLIIQKATIAFEKDLVSGGLEVDPPHLYPFMVTLNYNHFLCGGALISRTWVMTAAHCLKRHPTDEIPSPSNGVIDDAFYLSNFNVGLGVHIKAEPQLKKGIDQIKVHPLYGVMAGEDSQIFDIALLRLDSPVEYNSIIQPICLPPEYCSADPTELNQLMSIIAGWGKTEEDEVSRILKTATVTVWPAADCLEAYNNSIYKEAMMNLVICAGNRNGINACQGDSGTPLFLREDDRFYVIGVTSKGPMQCGDSKPVVYTRLSKFVAWIREFVTDANDEECGKSGEQVATEPSSTPVDKISSALFDLPFLKQLSTRWNKFFISTLK